jgi:ESCRT-II complex subunit VPS36
MSLALRDLAALAAQAEQMVALARALSGKLARAAPGDEEASASAQSVVSSSLVRLGLQAPALTAKDVLDERAYHVGLARELARVLLSTDSARGAGLMGRGKVDGQGGAEEELRGVVGLDEAWCFWNRARGVGALL